jgi:hypothetical protein
MAANAIAKKPNLDFIFVIVANSPRVLYRCRFGDGNIL